MREHAIPQAVTSYEFHLIGNMTLKQFLELASGFFFAFLVYSTNLPAIIKWPIVIILVAIGALVAFVPFEGRPLDQWLIALVRVIYKPTEFYWRKQEVIPDYFTYTASSHQTYQDELDLTPIKQKRIQEYINTLPMNGQINPIDVDEINKVNSVLALFDQVGVQHISAQPLLSKPDVDDTSTHSLQPLEKLMSSQTTVSQLSTVTNIPEIAPVEVAQTQPIVDTADLEATQAEVVNVFSAAEPEVSAPVATQVAQTSGDLPFPQKPTIPNIIVGMVFDGYGNIVENAIVEISDHQGLPVRAVKTNVIGQFSISTPLANGTYFISIDKEGLQFQPLSIELTHAIVDPLAIRAQA